MFGKSNDSQLLGTKAAGFVQHLDERLQGHKLVFWSISVPLMQINGRGQVSAVRQVAEDENLAFYETLSIPRMKSKIERNPES